MPYSIDMSQFSDIIRDFADYKLITQGCSQKTIDEYLTDLRTFFRYIISSRDGIEPDTEAFDNIDLHCIDVAFIGSITPSEVYHFLSYATEGRNNKPAARARKLSAIKALYKYLVNRKHLLSVNPVIDIETPKKGKTLPKFLSVEESVSLLNSVKNDEMSQTRIRDYCIITLFLNCGMRLSELAGIKTTDIDPELRSLRVTGKGSKERIIYLNPACRASLAEYIEERKAPKYKNCGNILFLSGRGRNKPLSVKTIQWMVKKYLDEAGLGNRGYSVHKLRHTAATLMYQSGQVDVRTLKDILGHEQLNTTQIYTHVSNKDMEEAMIRNPLSDIEPPETHKFKKENDSDDDDDDNNE